MLNSCKNFGALRVVQLKGQRDELAITKNIENKPVVPFLVVHGNVLYSFNYKSYVDTPFTQTDLMQNQIQTTLNMSIKGLVPVKMTIYNRYNNSPYLRNNTEVSVEFNQKQVLEKYKKSCVQK